MSDFLWPPRWKDGEQQASLAERAAGQTIRELPAPAPLNRAQLDRIWARVYAHADRRISFRLFLTATVILLLAGTAVASAARLGFLPRWLMPTAQPKASWPGLTKPVLRRSGPARSPSSREMPAPPATETVPAEGPPVPPPSRGELLILDKSPARASQASAGTRLAPQAKAAPPWPAVEQAPAARPVAMAKPDDWQPQPWPSIQPHPAPQRLPAPRRLSAPMLAPPTPSAAQRPSMADPTGSARPATTPWSPKAEAGSARALAEAIRALRNEHAAARALALLDQSQAQLAADGFGHEALLVRVESLLALHHDDEVLRLLDASTLAEEASSRSLRLTRGELRAAAGRCAEALQDFEWVLANGANPRALHGRDACRKRLAREGAGSRPPE